MSEAVKMPHIDLVYDHCDSAVIGELVNFLKSKYRNISITVNSSQEETDNDDNWSMPLNRISGNQPQSAICWLAIV